MRILLTNTSLSDRTGSELYLCDVATRLLKRGHSPLAFSPRLGPLASALRQATVPVVDRLDAVGDPPDVIHGQHHLETLTALLHFPNVPAVFVCHGWTPWEELAPRFPRIFRYVAVDHTTRDRLVSERGVAAAQVEVVLNFVDLERFRARGPLPAAPRRALVFSNRAYEGTHLPAVREACSRFDIEVDVAGIASGRPAAEPEKLLLAYDLVFAKGRAALEAIAVGAAVVLCDQAGVGPMVTTENLDGLRNLNFGIRALRDRVEPERLASRIERYDPRDAARVSQQVRATAGIDAAVERLTGIYERVLTEYRDKRPPSAAEESRAAAAYLHWVNSFFKERLALLQGHETLLQELGELRRREGDLTADRTRLSMDLERLSAQAGRLGTEIDDIRRTVTWRLRERLVGITPLFRAYRFFRRFQGREATTGDAGPGVE